ncbi:unnamed protein product [Adineta ricciae]|uniref:Uncharacterized protein n=1 Tax=Adineta ricciae TaxID=249248 RepID=A0A814WDB4_ADIRI|nr:unnamed protein product [Adineta ricciae]
MDTRRLCNPLHHNFLVKHNGALDKVVYYSHKGIRRRSTSHSSYGVGLLESNHSETESFAKLYIHLKFNETGDVIAKDNSDNDYFGILRNNAMFVAGRNNDNAALLNGVNGYVELPRDLVLSSADFTITTYVC